MKNIRKKITKALSGLVIAFSLFSVNTYAVSIGWNKQGQADITSWSYVYSDGSYADGWQYINNNWYYFSQLDHGCFVGYAYKDSNGNWCNISNSSCTIDGKDYFFNKDGQLITNADIRIGSSGKYHIDENGNLIDLN